MTAGRVGFGVGMFHHRQALRRGLGGGSRLRGSRRLRAEPRARQSDIRQTLNGIEYRIRINVPVKLRACGLDPIFSTERRRLRGDRCDGAELAT